MKEIKLYLTDIDLFKEITKICIDEKIIKSIQDNEDYTVVKIDDKNEKHILNFYYNLSIYLVSKFVEKECLKYPKKNQEEIKSYIGESTYFIGVVFVELIRFFELNDVFKETIFLKFNIKGFKEEIDTINKGIRYKKERDEFNQSFYKDLVRSGFKVNNYEVLRVEYDTDNLKLINKVGESLTPKNVDKILNIALKFETTDKWLYDLAFCSTICMILKVKELIIPSEYIELYEDLKKHNDFEGLGTKLILED